MALDGGEVLELLCPICYGDQGESGYATLVCGHVFHSTCLERSLKVKKECPSCRCPARPLDTGRRDAGPQVKCPCKTGQPVRLYHLQRPRPGGDDPTQPSSGAGGGGGSVDVAALAAAEQRAAQRENRLREALLEERRRVSELELEVARQQGEVVKALEKAERRKQRLAAMAEDHQAATTRLVEDKSRLEAREREQSEELSRMRQALHGLRMEQEKTRAALYERDEAVMRLKREVALQRARAGGNGGLQPREMAELLGERKEDWQMVYSIKVEELRRAQDAAAELKVALAKAATDADSRVAAERLAGAERVKAVAQERDDAKRELMDLEYKLHEAERRLRQHQPSAAAAASAGPRVSAAAAVAAKVTGAAWGHAAAVGPTPLQPSRQQQQVHQRRPFAALPSAAMLESATVGEVADDGGDSDLEALAMMAMSCPVTDDEDDRGGVGEAPRSFEVGEVGDEAAGVLTQAERAAGKRAAAGAGGGGGSRPSGAAECADAVAVGSDDDVQEYDNTPYCLMGAVDAAPPPSKRQRQQAPAPAAAGSLPLANGDGLYGNDSDQQADAPDYEDGGDGELVPVLPRAFSGLFAGGSGQAAGLASRAVCEPSGLAGSAAAFGPSFAAKAGASTGVYGINRRGSLVGEGPDGRGGTARFPLTSSFAHNASKGTLGGKGSSSGRTGRGGAPARQTVAAAGRIEAFLKPMPQPNRR